MKKIMVLIVCAAMACTAFYGVYQYGVPTFVYANSADFEKYGPKPEADIREKITDIHRHLAIDPDSVRIEIDWSKIHHWPNIKGNPDVHGWLVPYTFNAKNRFGGYAGRVAYWASVKDGRVLVIEEAPETIQARIAKGDIDAPRVLYNSI